MSAEGPQGPGGDARRRPLVATYRVQLRPEFGYAAATSLVDYLADLGVSHLYCSPYLQAAPGSAHGYDVVDPTHVNAELGGATGRDELSDALAAHGLGQVLDVVPNHMAIAGPENRWWWDVLANGRASRYAGHFDIDWERPGGEPPAKILLPVLGDDLDQVIEAGELALEPGDGGFVVRYHDHVFPVAPESFDGVAPDPGGATLRQVLDRQHYTLVHWRCASHELSYRRFFDVTTLIGVRVEDPAVFADTHRLVLGWLADGSLDGVRVDHVDGLRRPGEYLERLRAAAGADAWVVVEKILAGDERLPDSWPVDGTTGYDALEPVDALFVDPAGEPALTSLFAEVCGDPGAPVPFAEVVHASKRQVMDEVLAAEVTRLTVRLMAVLSAQSDGPNISEDQVRQMVQALLAEFPRYRAYVPEDGSASPPERAVIEQAATAALTRQPDLDPDPMSWLVDVLAGRWNGAGGSAAGAAGPAAEACMRFQQLSGPVMAKSVEDTAFYRYLRLVSRNEVGGDPERFAGPPAGFHASCVERASRWPEAMTTLTTHDTKRSEDVRARLAVLAEVPEAWAAFARRWLHDGPVDRPTQYLLLQTMVGAWPLPADRAVAYMEKATREAKLHTSWLAPDERYDRTVQELVERWSADQAFQASLADFASTVVPAGRVNALGQKVLQLTMPGVPDLYQGSELWDLSLVDPDNRRPVDYAVRAETLAALTASGAPRSFDGSADHIGRAKLWAVRQALAVRRRHLSAFGAGSGYRPLEAQGPAARHVVAFARLAPDGSPATVTAVTRLPIWLAEAGGWAATTLGLPPGRWVDALTGAEHHVTAGSLPVTDLLRSFPVAILEPFSTQ